ncbi:MULTISPECIES: DUF2142 domain-containing protein [Arthrobacter]|uniref:DUF2142 domain-containing protein n=1 Tax=Arthrobacter TaxID=1663 RepID=UPI001D1485C9|nr:MULTISPECIES: DUF2142 domain-containing protein [Arthrobacter]MCC3280948.1 DUF2142 domain-containing protein [Arthrobacter caoxuetaonis]MCC9192888.1 DUF2142 domain-containing protein [Arthrobacter sp. zg-Y916]
MFVLSFLLLCALGTLWSLASPLMSVPDENSHTVKAAAVARGELLGTPGDEQGDASAVTVPSFIASMEPLKCFAFDADTPASCADPVGNDTELVPATTTAGNYNPLYYFVTGFPSLFLSGAPAIYAMRIASAVFCAVFFAMTFAAASKFKRPLWPFIGAIVSITPMVLYLTGSINPNALEISAAAAFFLNLCVVLGSETLRSVRPNIVFVGISGFVLANTRPLSLLWMALAAAAALCIYGWRPLMRVFRDGLGLEMTALVGVGCGLSLAWFAVANSFDSLTGTGVDLTKADAAIIMLERTFDYATGYVGYMGWLDTPLPMAVYILWYSLMALLTVLGLTVERRGSRFAVFLLIASLVAVPPIMQAQVINELGWIWQGRYVLALVVVVLLCCGTVSQSLQLPIASRTKNVLRLLICLTAVAHMASFVFVLRRYAVGVTATPNWGRFLLSPEWQPPLPWTVLTLGYVCVVSVGGLLVYRYLIAAAGHISERTLTSHKRRKWPADL